MIMIEIIIILTLMMIMTFYYQADMKCFEYNFKCMYHIKIFLFLQNRVLTLPIGYIHTYMNKVCMYVYNL